MPPDGRPAPSLVTISAPYGTGGSIVGPRLAERLGVPFVDRAIPVAVSNRMQVSLDEALSREEPQQGNLIRTIAQLSPAAQMIAGAPLSLEVTAAEDEAFRITTEQILREYAAGGAVILGRAAAIVLRDAPGALHVRLDGPRERRLAAAMASRGISRENAEAELRASDVSREAYVKHWYQADPRDPKLYHLLIDSTSIDLDTCAEIIVLALAGRSAAGAHDAVV
jgi:cytidylate kinase